MCRKIFELTFAVCFHTIYWEIPSPDPHCNGIQHVVIQHGIKPCKNCWIAAGNSKKFWRKEGMRTTRQRRIARDILRFEIVYPIQDVTLRRRSHCPTWKRHYSWHTRAWAFRALALRRCDVVATQRVMQVFDRDPTDPIYNLDDDTAESGLLRLIEPADLPRNAAGQIEATHQMCGICHGSFVSNDPEEKHQAGDGGLRQIPCFLKHVFCLDCIRAHFIQLSDAVNDALADDVAPEDVPAVRCPFCMTEWTVLMKSTRTMKNRVYWFSEHYHERMLNSERDWAQDPQGQHAHLVGSVSEYIAVCSLAILVWPTFLAVHRSMSVWPRSAQNGGKLLPTQITVVALLGMLFQAVWPLIGPPTFGAYLSYRLWKSIALKVWKSERLLKVQNSQRFTTAREWALWLWTFVEAFKVGVQDFSQAEYDAVLALFA